MVIGVPSSCNVKESSARSRAVEKLLISCETKSIWEHDFWTLRQNSTPGSSGELSINSSPASTPTGARIVP